MIMKPVPQGCERHSATRNIRTATHCMSACSSTFPSTSRNLWPARLMDFVEQSYRLPARGPVRSAVGGSGHDGVRLEEDHVGGPRLQSQVGSQLVRCGFSSLLCRTGKQQIVDIDGVLIAGVENRRGRRAKWTDCRPIRGNKLNHIRLLGAGAFRIKIDFQPPNSVDASCSFQGQSRPGTPLDKR